MATLDSLKPIHDVAPDGSLPFMNEESHRVARCAVDRPFSSYHLKGNLELR